MKIFKKYNIIIYIFLIICATIIIAYNVFEYQKTKSIVIERKNIVDEQVPTNDNMPSIDFEKIRKKYDNKDIKGVIRIDNDCESLRLIDYDTSDFLKELRAVSKSKKEDIINKMESSYFPKLKISLINYFNKVSQIYKYSYEHLLK